MSTGCQKTPEAWNSSKPFKTQIVVGSATGLQFQIVELEGVQNQKTLEGEVVEFYLAPGEQNSELVGPHAVAKFIQNSEGVFIPTNSLSLQMVSLYYHMQALKKLEIQSLGKTFVKWPRKIGLQVKTNSAETRFNNAFYNNKLDVMFFVPYVDQELPLPLNGGIIAHEHFHSYFSYSILQKSLASDVLPIEDYFLKSINEGLADVWGWIYSDNPDFISLSLPDLAGPRKLEQPSFFRKPVLKTKKDMESDLNLVEQECKRLSWCNSADQLTLGLAYSNGTALARTLKDFLTRQNLTQEDKAKKIFLLLEQLNSLNLKKELDFESLLVEWAGLFDSLSDESCKILKNAIKTEEIKNQICLSF